MLNWHGFLLLLIGFCLGRVEYPCYITVNHRARLIVACGNLGLHLNKYNVSTATTTSPLNHEKG